MYVFHRDAVPADITAGTPNPDSWGPADFSVPASSCDVGPSNFKDLGVIVTDQLGGTFSSGTWTIGAAGQGQGTCSDITGTSPYGYITGTGGSLTDTHWSFSSIRTYTPA
jgi:hypothetical protein